MQSRPTLADLIAFNRAILEQAADVVRACIARRLDFQALAGPHLRHVMDHHAALLADGADTFLDYDHRARDRRFESDPALALERLHELQLALAALRDRQLNETVSVGLTIGTEGDTFMVGTSSLGRELLFLASHAIHHFALIRPRLEAAGVVLPDSFGKAPDTVRYEREQAAR